MTDERILEIAHRMATRYAHTVDPSTSFAFNKLHMIDFVRKILAEAAQESKP